MKQSVDIDFADETIYLLSICDKTEKENLTHKELNELLDELPE